MNKKSKILITGAGGMVGKFLSLELKRRGYNNLTLVDKNILNLMNREKTINFFKNKKPEYVFHVAARVGGVGDNIKRPVEFLRDNILINTNVIDATFICNAKKMINISSATIYSGKIQSPEEKDLFKDSLEKETEAYALSKIVGLKLCEYYNREYDTNFITLALTNLYGEYSKFDSNKSNVVSALIVRFHEAKKSNAKNVIVWGTGNAKREFIYVGDLVKLIISSAIKINSKDSLDGLLNCGFNDEYSIKELSKTISKVVGFKGKIVFDKTKPEGVKKRSINSSKISKLLELKNKTPLKKGLENTYKYFLETTKSN